MARSNAKPQEVKAGNEPKAGKKKMYKEPPPPNPAKKAAREAGFQQFIAREQLSVNEIKVVFDKVTQKFVEKLVAVPVPFIYDESRKHYVYSPATMEKEEK